MHLSCTAHACHRCCKSLRSACAGRGASNIADVWSTDLQRSWLQGLEIKAVPGAAMFYNSATKDGANSMSQLSDVAPWELPKIR